jgi:hypothetical protein
MQDRPNKLFALRLATRLLTTKELAGFSHALLVTPCGSRPDHSDQEWRFKEKLPTLTTQDMADYVTARNVYSCGHGCIPISRTLPQKKLRSCPTIAAPNMAITTK